MTDPNIRWTDFYFNLAKKFTQISHFRRITKSGILQSLPDLFNESGAFFDQLEKSKDPSIADPERFKKNRPQLVAAFTSDTVTTVNAAIDAACLVFAHSVVDALVSDVIRLAADITPNWWEKHLSNRKASFKEIREGGYAKVFETTLNNYLEKELLRDPLCDRIDVINQICQPCPPMRNPNTGERFEYDRARLEQLDKLRQDHPPGPN